MSFERGAAAVTGIIAGNGIAWAQSITVGGAVTAITAVGGATVGLVVLGIREINRARTEARKQWEEVHRESLAFQVEELTRSVAKARKSLHDFRDESQVRENSHTEEVARLMEQLRLVQSMNAPLREELARLQRRVAELTAEVDRLTGRIRKMTGSDVQDAIRHPTSEDQP